MKVKWSNEMLNAFHKISRLDKNLESIIIKYGIPYDQRFPNNFASLVRIIIGQQISRHVAEKIYFRLEKKNFITINKIINSEELILKKLGLSSRKIDYIKNLALNIKNGTINLKKFEKSSSENVFQQLINLKGIGKWTITNYRLFVLQDVDSWPTGDLAIKEALKNLFKLKLRPSTNEADEIANTWKPFRGAAALILWHYNSFSN